MADVEKITKFLYNDEHISSRGSKKESMKDEAEIEIDGSNNLDHGSSHHIFD